MKRLLIFSGSILLVLALVAGAGAFWLATRTIDISQFAPRIAAEIETVAPGLQVSLGPIQARRDPLRAVVEVDIGPSRLHHPALDGPVRIRSLRVDLSLLSLLRGKVSVRSVLVRGVQARLPVSFAELTRSDPARPPPTLPWAPGLRSVRLTDVILDLLETDRGHAVRLTVPSVAAYQNLLGGKVRLAGSAQIGHASARLPVAFKATATPDGPWDADVRAELQGSLGLLRLAGITTELPSAIPPTSLTAHLVHSGRLAADLELDMRQGSFVWPRFYRTPLALRRLAVHATWQESQPILDIGSATFWADNLVLQAAGRIDLAHLEQSRASARFAQMSPRQLVALWPEGIGGGGRRWIAANIRSGSIRDGQLTLAPGGKVKLDFGMHDLLATYRTPMPPLVHASGTGRLTEKGLTLALTHGSINGLVATPATIVIEDWAVKPNMMRVNMVLRGDLPRLLAVLDSKPLGFISRYGVTPATTSGTADGKLFLRFPLINALRTSEIEVQATARARGALVPDVYARRAFQQAELDFDIRSAGMTATGKGLVGPQPIALHWTEDFTGTKAAPSRYEIRAQTSVAALAQLDIDVSALASGPLDTQIDLDMKGPKLVRGVFHADARQAIFELPLLGRIKAAGQPADVNGAMRQQGDTLLIDSLLVQSPSVSMRAAARLPLAGGRSQFDIGQFAFARHRVSGEIGFGGGGPVSLEILGGHFDARSYLSDFSKPSATKAAAAAPSLLRTEIKARLDSIDMLNDVELKDFLADATIIGDQLTRMSATGRLAGQHIIKAGVTSQGPSRILSLSAANAGEFGRAFDLFRSGQGGTLDVIADIQGRDKSLSMHGRGHIKSMRVTDTPAMARLLTLASLTGLRDATTGRGILFETIDVPFRLQRGIIDVTEAKAIGPGLGLTMEGQVQQSLAALSLRGVIIPSYTLNAALGKIPLLGNLITGGKDQGLVGFNYRITGSAAAPKVDVQGASGLALGPLRRLFQGKPARVAPEQSTASQ